MLYETGALISGSAALKLVSGKAFHPNDIDFVVADSSVHIVKRYLESKGFEQDHSFDYSPNYTCDTGPGFHVERFVQQERSVDVTITTVNNLKLDGNKEH